ncbi:uncharacterized protein LOC106151528 [Lingula anatina]|uniref:Uncharacterized protein LOC106151528 n=1 Tax=Lingula anatina TaxID=7574 RepID=A0A1S3H587_LINAN|nr:uncharacterized protein LOC106151528 [Lingula anatina]|eukprot:XP_013380299.1 uncharacterized protein LOC106151528 [Lingula anatina]
MATNSKFPLGLPASSPEGGREHFLTCPLCQICLDDFEDPRMLPCFHTFCFKCISSYAKNNGGKSSFLCPVCHEKVPVPHGGMKKLRKNFLLKNVTDYVPERLDPNHLPCHLCCQHRCHKCHKVMTPVNHIATDLPSAASNGSLSPVRKPASSPTPTSTNGCREHAAASADKAADEHKDKMKSLADQIQGNIPSVQLQLDTASSQTGVVDLSQQKHSILVPDIEAHTKKLHSIVEEHTKNLVARVNSIYDTETEMLNKMQDKIDAHKANVDHVVQYAEILTKFGSDSEIIQQKPMLENRMKELMEDEVCQPDYMDKCRYNAKELSEKAIDDAFEDITRKLAAVKYSPPMKRRQLEFEINEINPHLFPMEIIVPFRVPSTRTVVVKELPCQTINTALFNDRLGCELDGIAVDPNNDDIYVVDRINSCVKLFTASGQYKLQINLRAAIPYPSRIAVVENGNIAVGCCSTLVGLPCEIRILSVPAAKNELSIAMSNIRDFKQGRRGLFLVLKVDTAIRKIYVFKREKVKKAMDIPPEIKDPWDMGVDRKTGNILLSDMQHCVWILDQHGDILSHYGVIGISGSTNHMLYRPTGLCADQHGHILVGDSRNARIVMLTPKGELMHNVATRGNLAGPLAVAVNKWGQLLVTDCDGKATVKVFKYLM